MKEDNSRDIYIKWSMKALIGLSLLGLFLGFFLNFSFEERLLALVQSQLKKNLPCPLKYRQIDILYFPPGVQLREIEIPAGCIPRLATTLNFNYLNTRLSGIDFSAFVPIISFKAEGSGKKDAFLEGELAINGPDIAFSLEKTQISGRLLTKVLSAWKEALPLDISFNGKFFIDTDIKYEQEKLHHLELNLTSHDLKISSLQVRGFQLPPIDIGHFDAIAETIEDGQKLRVKKISLGSKQSALNAMLEGSIDLSTDRISQSPVQLKARFNMAPDLLGESMGSILKVYLNRFYHEDDGFYHVGIGGALGDMQFKPLPGLRK